MPSKITKVRGSLGCGKTFYLADRAIELMKRDGFDCVMYLAYTRGARVAIQEKLHEKLGLNCVHTEAKPNCPKMPLVGTIHSICFRQLGAGKNNMITAQKKREFQKISPLTYDATKDEDIGPELNLNTFSLKDKPEGNQAFIILSTCRNRKLDITQWETVVPPEERYKMRLTTEALVKFKKVYEEWKAKEGLMDYDDTLQAIIDRKQVPITMKHLFIDEFQDLFPLIYDVYATWRDQTPGEVYFGGDEHQTIYRFKGADEKKFLKEPHDALVQMPTNWRCPGLIWDYSKKIVKPVELYDTNATTSKNEGGLINHHTQFNLEKLLPRPEDNSTLYLARTNREVVTIYDALLKKGIPVRYTSKEGSLTDSFVKAYTGLCKTKPENNPETKLSIAEARQLIALTPAKQFLQAKIKTKAVNNLWPDTDLTVKEFFEQAFSPLMPPTTKENWEQWVKYLKISKIQAEFAKTRDYVPFDDITTMVGTAHSGKGMTSERVVLMDNMPEVVKRSWKKEEANERFLYHMAVGRASKQLDIVHSNNPYPFLSPNYHV